MSKSAPVITLRNGPTIISELEARHSEAEGTLTSAKAALQNANARYDAALGEGREAAISARRLCTDAEVDFDIARRSVDVLTAQVAAAREALHIANVEHKRAEAERLRGVFMETARQQLAAMGVGARTIIRSWAEAELAIQDARRAQGAGGPEIPSAESFRRVPRVERREINRTQVTLWMQSGSGNRPYHSQDEVIREGGKGRLPSGSIVERGVFERITYADATPSINLPLLIESISIPALIGDQIPGWHPTEAAHPDTVLEWLADLERAPAPKALAGETVDVFVGRVGGERGVPSA